MNHINGDPCRVASGPFLPEEDTSRRRDRRRERSVNVVTSSLAPLGQCTIITVLLQRGDISCRVAHFYPLLQ